MIKAQAEGPFKAEGGLAMVRSENPRQEGASLGRWARWTAAPYCAFKDDRARLFALVARDVRLLSIAIVLAVTGISLPWRTWIVVLLG